ncbi:isochorismatase family protein [Enteractinococcus helveticum]|uniref:Isochorismatase n=1 Tax=Enteractinococcus helveticum TaxID=1837282 RepID=A0A1B7LYN2_9MICC|nr:isochorismatase family protein [Enteractinococcus helveticum]OAV60495.1 isochorismatase [Enteractinococcus helveticum]
MSAPNRALVVIDVQNEYFDGPMEIQYPPRDKSLANILAAIDAAEQANIPVVIVQHDMPAEAPIFARGTKGWELHPDIEAKVTPETKHINKQYASVFDGTDFADWVRENNIDTITLTGHMTNNCVLGTAEGAEPHGVKAEVLSDATGAIHITNEMGQVPAQQVHETLMTILHSNFAAVTTTDAWMTAIKDGAETPMSNLVESAVQGKKSQN